MQRSGCATSLREHLLNPSVKEDQVRRPQRTEFFCVFLVSEQIIYQINQIYLIVFCGYKQSPN